MVRQEKTNVGVIGLGIIGSRVVANLRSKGFHAWVWSRSPKPEPNFLASPSEVADASRFIQIFVSDGAALIETVTAMGPELGPEHIVMNHATVSPGETREAARITQERHARYLDAPFTGSRDAAQSGQLVFMVGGDAETLAAARPVLEANASAILHVGGIGDGAALKVATNVIVGVSGAAYAEALALLSSSGVALEHLLEVLPHHAVRSPLARMKIPNMILDNFEPHFALKHMFKDIQIALGMAAVAGLETPATAAFAGSAMAGIQQGLADSDFSAIARLYPFPNSEAPLDEKYRPQPASTNSADTTAGKPSPGKPTPKRWGIFREKK